jgi:outer membrane immunogenic protein
MKSLLIAAVLAASSAGSALAADMAVKAPLVPPAPIFSWTGFYIGLEGGGAWADTRHTNALNGGTSGTIGISGGLVGGTYGYNWQQGSVVFGFEGDLSWSGIKSTFFDNGNPTLFCPAAFNVPCMTNLRWFGTDRARIGYAWDHLLIFGTAGVAYGSVQGSLFNTVLHLRLAKTRALGSWVA